MDQFGAQVSNCYFGIKGDYYTHVSWIKEGFCKRGSTLYDSINITP